MSRGRWQIWLAAALVAAAGISFAIQILIFHRPSDTLFYSLQDLGFAWINVLLVTLVIDQLLHRRELASLQHKLNMVISAFFNEAGLTLLHYLSRFDSHVAQIKEITKREGHWTARQFQEARKRLEAYDYSIDCQCADLNELRELVASKRQFFVQLLTNPNLLEHESFTELLWAISHLAQELTYREDLDNLSEKDYHHLEEDMRRVYILLTYQWVLYSWHLQHDNPYLYEYVRDRSPFEDQPMGGE